MHLDHALSCVCVYLTFRIVFFRQLLLLLQSQFEWYVVVRTRRLNENAKSKNVCVQNKLIAGAVLKQRARFTHMHLKKSFCLTHFMLNHSVLIVIQEAITFYVSHHISPYLTILSAFDAEYKVIKVIFFYPFCVKLFHRRLAKRRLIAIRLSSKSRHITLRMNNIHLLYISELTQQMTRKLSDEERRVTCTLRKLVFITSI